MGGLVGMVAAATALTGRISHLVLNDVGPAIAPTAVQRILQYAGNPPVFATVPEAERYFREIYAAFGVATDAGWRSEEHTSELQSLMRISYAVFCLKKKNQNTTLMIDNDKYI